MKTWKDRVENEEVYEDDGVWYKNLDDEEIIDLARQEHDFEGEIEVDDGASVSRGADNGAYVQAWVWVYFPTVEPEDDD